RVWLAARASSTMLYPVAGILVAAVVAVAAAAAAPAAVVAVPATAVVAVPATAVVAVPATAVVAVAATVPAVIAVATAGHRRLDDSSHALLRRAYLHIHSELILELGNRTLVQSDKFLRRGRITIFLLFGHLQILSPR